jgi:hypothetical protein
MSSIRRRREDRVPVRLGPMDAAVESIDRRVCL